MTDPRGPVAYLERRGLPEPLWARTEIQRLNEGRPEWHYRADFLDPIALLPVAHLIASEYQVTVFAGRNEIRIRIKNPNRKESKS